MPDPAWPTSLPSPRVDFTGSINHGVVRTQMDSGRVRQRRRFLARQQEWSFELFFTESQFDTFKNFVKDDLEGGSNYFTMDVIGSTGIVNKTIRMIGGEYSFKQVPPSMWLVSMAVEDSYVT